MIKTVILFLFNIYAFSVFSQTGINTRTPHASAALEVSATDRGVLTPQYILSSLTDSSDPVASPLKGSLIYNTGGTYSRGYYYWDGEKWNRMIVNTEMDKVLNLKISGTYTMVSDTSKILIPTTPADNYISFSSAQKTQYINTMGIANPTGTDIALPAGTYKVDISMDCVSPTSPGSNYLIGDKHLYVIDAAIVDASNVPLTDVKTASSISNAGNTSVQGYSFSFVFSLTTPKTVKVLLRRGSGVTTNVPTRTNQSGLVVNFYKMFE